MALGLMMFSSTLEVLGAWLFRVAVPRVSLVCLGSYCHFYGRPCGRRLAGLFTVSLECVFQPFGIWLVILCFVEKHFNE